MSTLVRLLLIALVGGGALAVAGDQAAARPGQEATPTPTPAPEEQLEEFVPTEKLPADQAVAFPVDI